MGLASGICGGSLLNRYLAWWRCISQPIPAITAATPITIRQRRPTAR